MALETARLYLLSPVLRVAEDLPIGLAEVLASGDIACLLVKVATSDAGSAKKIIQKIEEIAQPQGVAVIIEGDGELALRTNADGLHLSTGLNNRLRDELKSHQPKRSVGISGLKGRDDAMEAGEAGVDYLMFGEPAPDGYVPPVAQTIERAEWWAGIFNIPCVAYAHHLADVAAVSATGADFVALGEAVWSDKRGPAMAIQEAQKLLQPLPDR